MSRALQLLCVIAWIGLVGCDSAENPVAPTGTVVTASANPSSVDVGQQSTVTVSAIRSDGNPDAGRTFNVSTDFGSLSAPTVTLNAQGRGTVVFTAPSERGTATVTVSGDAGSASVQIEVTSDAGQVALDQDSIELEHSRSGSNCDDPIDPKVAVSNLGTDAIDFKIIDDLPDWLKTDVTGGPVPGSFQALFTCDVGDGDLDLTHVVRVQGIDPVTKANVGDEDTVTVDVHVRD